MGGCGGNNIANTIVIRGVVGGRLVLSNTVSTLLSSGWVWGWGIVDRRRCPHLMCWHLGDRRSPEVPTLDRRPAGAARNMYEPGRCRTESLRFTVAGGLLTRHRRPQPHETEQSSAQTGLLNPNPRPSNPPMAIPFHDFLATPTPTPHQNRANECTPRVAQHQSPPCHPRNGDFFCLGEL